MMPSFDISLFILDFAPCGACRAIRCYHECGKLLPHRFTLTAIKQNAMMRRFIFCGAFHRLIRWYTIHVISYRQIYRPVVNRRNALWSSDFPQKYKVTSAITDISTMKFLVEFFTVVMLIYAASLLGIIIAHNFRR